MYFTPLHEPLNAFDRLMFLNNEQAFEASRFDTEYVNSTQFVNILNNFTFSSLLGSEVDTNRLIGYVKDNLIENRSERKEKQKYVIIIILSFI